MPWWPCVRSLHSYDSERPDKITLGSYVTRVIHSETWIWMQVCVLPAGAADQSEQGRWERAWLWTRVVVIFSSGGFSDPAVILLQSAFSSCSLRPSMTEHRCRCWALRPFSPSSFCAFKKTLKNTQTWKREGSRARRDSKHTGWVFFVCTPRCDEAPLSDGLGRILTWWQNKRAPFAHLYVRRGWDKPHPFFRTTQLFHQGFLSSL